MNRPWMPLYIAEYLADTGHLTAAEHGAYMLLIMHYWQKDGLPSDERQLARIARLSPEEWRDSRDTLAAFFGDNWCHGRIDDEIAHAEDIISKRKAAAELRHSRRNANADASAPPNAEQMNTHTRVIVHVDGILETPSEKVSAPARARDPGPFPSDGSIAYSPYADIARSARPGVDPDILASNFRKFLFAKQIPFDEPKMSKTFRTFCTKHKVAGLN